MTTKKKILSKRLLTMTKKKKTYRFSITVTPRQRIKEHIKEHHKPIIEMLREQNKCNHQWQQHQHGFKCENCDYYTGMDKRLNQLIKKLK